MVSPSDDSDNFSEQSSHSHTTSKPDLIDICASRIRVALACVPPSDQISRRQTFLVGLEYEYVSMLMLSQFVPL